MHVQPRRSDDPKRDRVADPEVTDRARKISLICLAASLSVGVAYVIDVALMPHCGPVLIDPGWFAVGMIGLAVASVVEARTARAHAPDDDVRDHTGLVIWAVAALCVMVVGSAFMFVATGLVQAFDCTGGTTPPL